jgi:5'-phosphate synthase pdxT subunit
LGPIGVLCLQGDYREHLKTLSQLGIETKRIRLPEDLIGLSGLVIPGGESTVIDKLSHINGVFDPIKRLLSQGMPAFGTCAGLIMLAERISDGIQGQESFGGLNITVQRNAFGSQLDSFEASVPFLNDYVSAAFIRAPIVSQVSEETEIISKLPTGEIVGVREGNIMGISFHPELVGELAVHSLFVEMCKKADFRAEL